ncbi:MAG: tetratricopeptide repeat protein, partial [Candidatus Electrothrix sp. ATG1]|nr:tetratricopeptide repeat protein [Candidatus Electrothrix sp. ATG1]
ALLEEQPADREDRSLLASLELSLERLPEQCREWLPRLGVFQGGCSEEMVGRVTGIEEADWQELRSHLLRAGLMRDEQVPNTGHTFLRFHPTLAPALWQKLSTEKQSELTVTHWRAYYQLSQKLYVQDSRTPYAARDYARVELANLLRAVSSCLETGQEKGLDFTDKVNRFLNAFGMQRERQTLVEAAAKEERDVGSQSWFLSQYNLGEQLLYKGQAGEAEGIFRAMLKNVGKENTYNRCLTLHMLGRCLKFQVQHAEAKKLYLMAIAELSRLEEHHEVEREIALVQTDLGEVLRDEGNYKESKCAYEIALEVCTNQNDYRQQLAVKEHIGTLALVQNDLAEAAQWYQNGLESSRRLNEPDLEALFLYQFGLLYQKRNKLQKSEQMYRESARLREKNGVMGGPYGAATSWDSLACVIILAGRPKEAESWYRKAIAASKQAEDQSGAARIMSNLAGLLWGMEVSGI